MRIAVTGAAGRLGGRVSLGFAAAGHEVVMIDVRAPYIDDRSGKLDFRRIDLSDTPTLTSAFRRCDAVVHLAGLHGVHLEAMVNRTALWRANVAGSCSVIDAAVGAKVRRLVVASSTSVYGPGTPEGEARVLSETTDLRPDDVYDMSKLATERAAGQAHEEGKLTAVALRMGRFYFGTTPDYHLRKLSTGLDIHDAVQALRLVVTHPKPPSPVYCVASDLLLSHAERRRLGLDLPAVLEACLPGFGERLRELGVALPARVGKSVDTSRLRHELGYQPERDLQWWKDQLDHWSVSEPPPWQLSRHSMHWQLSTSSPRPTQ